MSMCWENFKCLDFLDAAKFVVDFNNGVQFKLFFIQYWALCNSRNDLVCKGKSKATSFIFLEAFTFIEAFDAVHGDSATPFIQDNTQWSPLRDGWVKLNLDVSLSISTNGAGLGSMVHNSQGIVLSAHVIFHQFVIVLRYLKPWLQREVYSWRSNVNGPILKWNMML